MIDQDLSNALRQTGERVTVPIYPASEVIAKGRAVRRRRRAMAASGASAGIAAIAIVGFLLPNVAGNPTPDQRPGSPLNGNSASDGPSSSISPNIDSTKANITDPASMVLPIDSYESTALQISAEQRAEYELESQCLKGFGLNWAPPTITAPNSGGGPNTRLYGVPGSLEIARTYGFHFVSYGTRVGDNPALTQDEKNVMYGYVRSFNGMQVPSGGCVRQPDRVNAAAPLPANPVAATIDADSFTKSLADPRVVAAQTRWSACMRGIGYNYKTTFTAVVDTGDRASAHEIAIAVASWTCAARVGLVQTWFNVQSAYQNQEIALHADALASERSQIAQRAAYVQQVLNSHATQ
ncbi:MAG: hypothetical protein JWR52_1774 [Marmoricola sp.]|nr:hypothetical protein [Marmoricola sp.]